MENPYQSSGSSRIHLEKEIHKNLRDKSVMTWSRPARKNNRRPRSRPRSCKSGLSLADLVHEESSRRNWTDLVHEEVARGTGPPRVPESFTCFSGRLWMEQLVAATSREPVTSKSNKNDESSVKRDVGAREEWSEGAICTLIDAYTAKYGELNGKGLRSKDWAEVVAAVNSNQKSTKTVEHCRNKMDTLTKRFKAERKNKLSGVESCWPWYHKMEIIRGCSPAKGVPAGNKLPIGGPEKDKTALNRPKISKRAKKTYTLEDLSAVASDQFEEKNKFPVESDQVLVDSNGKGKDRDPEGLDSIGVGAQTSDDQTLQQNVQAGAGTTTRPEEDESKYLARSIADLAGSLQRIAGNLRSSITEFAEMYARVEISKMEIFRDLELKRMQMQLDSQVKLATILNKRKRDDSESQ